MHLPHPGKPQFVAGETAVRIRLPIPGVGKSKGSESAFVAIEELFQRRHFRLIQVIQPDLPRVQKTRTVAVPLRRAVEQPQNLMLKTHRTVCRVLRDRARLELGKCRHSYRSFTTSLMELRLSMAFRTACAISSL